LAVVHGGKKGGREEGRVVSVKSLHHFRPPPTPEQAIMWLNRTMEVREGGREGGREGVQVEWKKMQENEEMCIVSA
jgi:hypothetical protein